MGGWLRLANYTVVQQPRKRYSFVVIFLCSNYRFLGYYVCLTTTRAYVGVCRKSRSSGVCIVGGNILLGRTRAPMHLRGSGSVAQAATFFPAGERLRGARTPHRPPWLFAPQMQVRSGVWLRMDAKVPRGWSRENAKRPRTTSDRAAACSEGSHSAQHRDFGSGDESDGESSAFPWRKRPDFRSRGPAHPNTPAC